MFYWSASLEINNQVGLPAVNLTLYRYICVLYVAGLLLGSVIPADESTVVSRSLLALNPSLQNLLHIPAFLGVAVLFLMSHRNPVCSGVRKRFLTTFAMGTLLGVVFEAVQITVPGRYPSLMDAVLNMVGIIIGIWIYRQCIHPRLKPE